MSRSVYGDVGRVPHVGLTCSVSLVLPGLFNLPYTFNAFHISKPSKTLGAGHVDTADAVEIHDVPRDQQPLLHDRLLLLHADLGDHTDPPLPSNISLWGGLVQGQFCTQV